MSTEPKQNSADVAVKPMKGKYDKRRYNGAHRAAVNNRGRKPNWVKHLERNHAGRMLDKLDAIATVEDIYTAAWNAKNLALCTEIRKQLSDRFMGRPFIAENPAKAVGANALTQDEWLQTAIKQLIPQPSAKTVM